MPTGILRATQAEGCSFSRSWQDQDPTSPTFFIMAAHPRGFTAYKEQEFPIITLSVRHRVFSSSFHLKKNGKSISTRRLHFIRILFVLIWNSFLPPGDITNQ